MLKKAFVGAMLAGAMIMAGCSSNTKHQTVDQLGQDVQVVGQKVDKLQGEVNDLKQETLVVRGEAARANQRLDNQAQSYRK